MKLRHLLWLAAAACGEVSTPAVDGGNAGSDGGGDGGAGFAIHGPTEVQYVRRGEVLDVPVTLDPALAVPVSIALDPIAGVTAAPAVIAPGATSTTLHLTTTGSTPVVRARVGITGTAGATASTPLALDVLGARGTLDPTYGSGGVATFAIAPDAETFQFAVARGDGVVVGATVREGDKTLLRVVRRDGTGAANASFGTAGVVTIDVATIGLADPTAIASGGPSGGLVIAGYGRNADNVTNPFVVTLDAGGQVQTATRFATGTANVQIQAMAVGPSGEIVLAGSRTNGSGDLDAALLRLSTPSTLDAAFGSGGTVTFPEASVTRFQSVAIQSDGRIVGVVQATAAGSFSVPAYSLRRFGVSGQLDGAFGGSGKATLPSPTGSPIAYTVVALGGDELVVGGSVRAQSLDEGDPAIWRLRANGTLDLTFAGGAGYHAAGATPRSESIQRLVIGDGGVIYGAGSEIESFAVVGRVLLALGPAGSPVDVGTAGLLREATTDMVRALVAGGDHRLHVLEAPLGVTATTDTTIRTYFQ